MRNLFNNVNALNCQYYEQYPVQYLGKSKGKI